MSDGGGSLPDPVVGARVKRPLIVAAVLALALCVGAVTYFYSDDLISHAQALLSGHPPHAQGHIRY
jgi:hypothetical protein